MPSTYGKHPPPRALLLSLAALAVPVAGAFWVPEAFEDYEALLWLVPVLPAFLFAYYRGWRGAATSLAACMAVLSVTYAVTQTIGRSVPELLLPVVVFFIFISLGAGGRAERLRAEAGDGPGDAARFTDAATGLPNRSHGLLHLELEFSAAQRGRSLALVLLDLENFKGYNAQHGNAAGDDMLHILGEVLKRTTRRMNLSARFGEDELLCILGGCDDDGALIFISRFQEALRAVAGQRPLPAISGGVATYNPGMRTQQDLLDAAENALRHAKRDGSGRIRVHGRISSLPLAGVDAVEPPTPAAEVPAAAGAATVVAAGRGRKALIVTETASVRELLARFLADHGFTVAQVSNVVDGVQCLSMEYDLLFTDISLSEGVGLELVRAAKLRWPSLQVVGIMQPTNGDVRVDTLNAGVDRYVVAPLDFSKVRQHMNELLARRDRFVNSVLDSRQLTLEFQARSNAAVEALKHTEEEYRNIVATLHEVIFRTDKTGTFIFLNSAWTEATGHAIADSVGQQSADFVHEEDRGEFTAAVGALLAGDRADAHSELRILTHTGAARWFELRMRRMFDADSRITGIAGTLDDVTARKGAEEALRRSEAASRGLLAALPDEVFRLNREGIILGGDGAEEGTRAAATVGGSIEQLFPPPVAGELRACMEHVLRTGETDVYEYRVVNDEVVHEFEVRLAPGGNNEIVAIVRNITEKKQLEEQLRQSQKLEAIGRLAGGLAHDFNNLLTVVQGNAQLLREDPASDSASEYLMQIESAAQRGASLVQQLLAFGRRQVLQPTILNLNTVVERTRSMLVRLLGEQIVVHVDLDPSLGLVKADPGQIEQILMNLAVNARDAMQAAGSEVRIATRNAVLASHGSTDGAEDDVVLLSFSDDGAGMDETTRKHLFEPFFTTKSFAQASGLGLATVYGIVRQSGGSISVASAPGRGTTFEIALPRVDA